MADNKNYIDKKEMYDEVVKSQEQGKCSERLGYMFMLLCEKYSHHYWFREYERRYGKAFKEDLLSAGLTACVRAWPKFDVNESNNPFSYFTTCVLRAYQGYLTKEYGWINTKNAAKVESGLRGDYGYEEMIKEQEEGKIDDEENNVYNNPQTATQEDSDDTPDYPSSDEETLPELPEKDYAITNPLVESMALWDDDEPEDQNQSEVVSSVPSIADIFGVKRTE